MVACTTLVGVFVRMHFVKTLCTPAASMMARTAPPAMTPVPSLAEPPPNVLGVEIGIDDPSGKAMQSFHAALRRAEKNEGQAHLLC